MEAQEGSLKMIQEAIQRLIEENREEGGVSDCHSGVDGKDWQSFSCLLSQLELLKDGRQQHSPASMNDWSLSESTEAGEACNKNQAERMTRPIVTAEEVLKELKNVKRQNRITHWLLSAMILMTTFWQLSEVSFLLLIKQKLSHPFRALGSLLLGSFKGATVKADQRKASEKIPAVEVPLHPLGKLPEFPSVDILSSIRNSSGKQ